MKVRDATAEDVPALARVKQPAVIHADRIRGAADGDFRYLVAVDDTGDVVGHACLVFHHPRTWSGQERPLRCPMVVDLMIRADRRREGLGSGLLTAMESICASGGHARLDLDVDHLDPDEDPAALRFYTRNGYETISDEPVWSEWSFRDSDGNLHHGSSLELELFKDLPPADRLHPAGEMTADRAAWFVTLFDELALGLWIDGGWGVDALLGRQSRRHRDLDIIIPRDDGRTLIPALRRHGFVDVFTDDRSHRNFVFGHPERGLVDFHVVHPHDDGGAIYGPGDIDFVITADELDATGCIAGRRVRCLSPEYQVRSHAGYDLGPTDLADVRALHDAFGVPLLPEHL